MTQVEDLSSDDFRAMQPSNQRGKVQEQSQHNGSLPHTGDALAVCAIIRVNTFRNPHGEVVPQQIEPARSTGEEKQSKSSACTTSTSVLRTRRRRCWSGSSAR